MSPALNAEEILEVAVQIEKMGAAYYRRAAELAENPAAQKMFAELAEMEDGHEIVFENMRADPDVLSQLIGDPEGEAALYLRAFAGGKVFPKEQEPMSNLDPEMDVIDVLRKAVLMELASIAFYQGIKDALPPNFNTTKLEKIISEERGHVTMLSEQLARLLT